LGPFGTLLDVELDELPLFQVPEAFTANCSVMDKQVRACLLLDEAITFGSIEPFDGSTCSFRHFLPFTYFVRRKELPVLAKKKRPDL
jgi:hypothetical protein